MAQKKLIKETLLEFHKGTDPLTSLGLGQKVIFNELDQLIREQFLWSTNRYAVEEKTLEISIGRTKNINASLHGVNADWHRFNVEPYFNLDIEYVIDLRAMTISYTYVAENYDIDNWEWREEEIIDIPPEENTAKQIKEMLDTLMVEVRFHIEDFLKDAFEYLTQN